MYISSWFLPPTVAACLYGVSLNTNTAGPAAFDPLIPAHGYAKHIHIQVCSLW